MNFSAIRRRGNWNIQTVEFCFMEN